MRCTSTTPATGAVPTRTVSADPNPFVIRKERAAGAGGGGKSLPLGGLRRFLQGAA